MKSFSAGAGAFRISEMAPSESGLASHMSAEPLICRENAFDAFGGSSGEGRDPAYMTSPLCRMPAGPALGSLASVAPPSEPARIAYREKEHSASSPLVPFKAKNASQRSFLWRSRVGPTHFTKGSCPLPKGPGPPSSGVWRCHPELNPCDRQRHLPVGNTGSPRRHRGHGEEKAVRTVVRDP